MYMVHIINHIVLLWLFFFTFAKNKNLTYYAIYKRCFKTKRLKTK